MHAVWTRNACSIDVNLWHAIVSYMVCFFPLQSRLNAHITVQKSSITSIRRKKPTTSYSMLLNWYCISGSFINFAPAVNAVTVECIRSRRYILRCARCRTKTPGPCKYFRPFGKRSSANRKHFGFPPPRFFLCVSLAFFCCCIYGKNS